MASSLSFATERTVKPAFWATHRESACNWLALGLLLAAWNAADNEGAQEPKQRPESLRGYPTVSVRAIQRSAGD
jgi:hypothetical protein